MIFSSFSLYSATPPSYLPPWWKMGWKWLEFHLVFHLENGNGVKGTDPVTKTQWKNQPLAPPLLTKIAEIKPKLQESLQRSHKDRDYSSKNNIFKLILSTILFPCHPCSPCVHQSLRLDFWAVHMSRQMAQVSAVNLVALLRTLIGSFLTPKGSLADLLICNAWYCQE